MRPNRTASARPSASGGVAAPRTTVESWSINLAIVVGGRAIGACGLSAEQFPTLRSFETGSWITQAEQGRGYGKEMRAALLHLGFAGFDAVEATTAAFSDNPRSLGVTRHFGYEPNGSGADDAAWHGRRDPALPALTRALGVEPP